MGAHRTPTTQSRAARFAADAADAGDALPAATAGRPAPVDCRRERESMVSEGRKRGAWPGRVASGARRGGGAALPPRARCLSKSTQRAPI